jgi:hypothetical protein
MVVKSVVCAIQMKQSNTSFYLVLLFALFGVWLISLIAYHQQRIFTNMFVNWPNRLKMKDKTRIRIGISALCWSMYTTRNDFFLTKQNSTIFLQIIIQVVHWIQLRDFILLDD